LLVPAKPDIGGTASSEFMDNAVTVIWSETVAEMDWVMAAWLVVIDVF
jgi:hypothetical protein